MERTIKGRQIIYTVRKPIEARLATFEVKRQAEQFYIDAERRREEKSNVQRKRPHADWVRQNPLPSAHELFSDVRPTSTLISPNREPLIRTISTQTEISEVITLIQPSITPVTSVQPEPTVPSSKISSSDLVPIKLTRHQRRKLRKRKLYEENPEAPRFSRRHRRDVNRVAEELIQAHFRDQKRQHNGTRSDDPKRRKERDE